MKQAKLKIDYFTCSNDGSIKDAFKKGDILTYDKKLKMYYRKETNSLSTYPEIFIEKNTDIFEIFEEPEPQEEVIEGWVEEKFIENNWYEFIRYRKEDSKFTVPATLILNPKKKKEEYSFVLHNEIIKKFRQSYYLSKSGEYSDHILCTLIRNKKADEKHTKIKITVEE